MGPFVPQKTVTMTFFTDCGIVGCGCRIHRLLFCKGVRLHFPTSVLDYDTKKSDGEAPVILDL